MGKSRGEKRRTDVRARPRAVVDDDGKESGVPLKVLSLNFRKEQSSWGAWHGRSAQVLDLRSQSSWERLQEVKSPVKNAESLLPPDIAEVAEATLARLPRTEPAPGQDRPLRQRRCRIFVRKYPFRSQCKYFCTCYHPIQVRK